jgi:hypothetical protein
MIVHARWPGLSLTWRYKGYDTPLIPKKAMAMAVIIDVLARYDPGIAGIKWREELLIGYVNDSDMVLG